MRYTLLEMVQLILSSMDSEEVNSISDTVESEQVANLLKSVYYDIATDLELPEHETLFQLTASGDANIPVLMTVPSTVTKVREIRYNCKETADTYPDWRVLEYKPFPDFLEDQQSLREWTTGVDSQTVTLNGSTYEMLYRTDKMPQYYTTADDQQFFFDSLDITIDTTLQASKTMCSGSVYPTFTLSDAFAPDLDPTQFAYFINRAKVRAFNELKQVANEEAIGEARRQKIIVQKRKRKTPNLAEVYRLGSRFGRK